MELLTWSIAHAVFVPELDDEHLEIVGALGTLQGALSSDASSVEVRKATDSLISSIEAHFAHEERLMRASRYSAMRWHQGLHMAALKRMAQRVDRLHQGRPNTGNDLVTCLSAWLHDHMLVADRMLGAFLRNQCRSGKITLRASTKPINACSWTDTTGKPFRRK